MSALRLARPGHPTTVSPCPVCGGAHIVELEPAIGRISHARAAIHGSLVTARVIKRGEGPSEIRTPERQAKVAEAHARYKAKHGPALSIRPDRCGKPLARKGTPCARRKGHAFDCRDRELLDWAKNFKKQGIER